jgi:hypothetical protein
VRPPGEQLGARADEGALEDVVEQDRPERRPEQEGGGRALPGEGEEERRHAGDGDDDGPGPEEGELEHRRLEPGDPVGAHPPQHPLVERLGGAGADAVGDPGEGDPEQPGGRGGRQHDGADGGAQVVEPRPGEHERAGQDGVDGTGRGEPAASFGGRRGVGHRDRLGHGRCQAGARRPYGGRGLFRRAGAAILKAARRRLFGAGGHGTVAKW